MPIIQIVRTSDSSVCGIYVPHVFSTDDWPVPENLKCNCGQQTWRQAVAEARKRFDERNAHVVQEK